MNKNYAKYENLNPNFKSHLNPYLLCLMSDVDKNFEIGDQGRNFGPDHKNCQLLIGEYIATANKWDMICETAASLCTPSISGLLFNPVNYTLTYEETRMTQGEVFLYVAGLLKYGKFYNCRKECILFDPLNPSSKIITDVIALDASSRILYDNIDTKNLDNDMLLNKLLEKPSVFYRILLGIYSTYKESKRLDELKNTKLYNFFENNKRFFNL